MSGSLKTPNEWVLHAHANMKNASVSHGKAAKQINTSKRTHVDCLQENLTMYHDLHTSLKDKVKTTRGLVDKLELRAGSVESTLAACRHSMAQLQSAHRAKEAPIALCTWRMDQREKRPIREQVRDSVELALEDERSCLLETQRKLVEAEKRTKKMITKLQDVHAELEQDLADKKQALTLDDMCLRTTHHTWQAAVDGGPPTGNKAATLPTPRKTNFEESGRNETSRQMHAVGLVNAAAQQQSTAEELCKENAKLIEQCQRMADQAHAKTDKKMQERVNDNQKMRRKLEGEIRELNGQIKHTKATLSETKAQIKSLDEPMALVTTRDSWRKQRALREQILDPVSTRLEDQKLSLIKTSEALRQQHMGEKGALADLQHHKEQLEEDLRDKTTALHIDLNCLTHEALNWHGRAVQNVSKTKLGFALKVDPTFTPAGGTHNIMTPQSAR
mmetsp:Transcript_29098/g.66942  ORF Transcript_29098/g.66942 Transcript_29098/m.66942 type:complete len:446 (+) Transcript_29098:59-1396(+)